MVGLGAYRGGKWRLPELMAKILAANEFCMDAISRVCVPHYRRGRVALVGDTAIAIDRYEAKYRDYVSISQKMNAGRLLAPRIPLGIVGRNLLFSTPTVFSPAMKAFGRVLRTFIV